MKNLISILTISITLMSCQSGTNENSNKKAKTMENDVKAIESVLGTYEHSLNTSDVSEVLSVYHSDGVFMPSELPTASGTLQLKESYKQIFNTIQLNIKFSITKIEVEGQLAYAQTYSKGEVTVKEAGITVPEENRELFIFKKK